MKKKVLITSALPYANGPLHFGHIAGAYLPADCYARFQRLQKNEVLYICGSDEYGIPITLNAELAGRTPKEHVDLYHGVIQEFFKQLDISFDHYSRTTWEGHIETTHQFFNDLLQNGYIEERITDQLYSQADQKFLADRYVVGTCPNCSFENARGDECPRCGSSYESTALKNPRSKLTNAPLEHRPTKHWFLLLEKFKERLTEWVASKNWKPNVTNFIKGYIGNLHARAITRDINWGIPVPLPDSEGKVLYVWFDAPIGYISATKEWALLKGEPERWKDFWLDPETKLINFMGKDNIPFHASIFPAMIMGQNQPYKLVDELSANEFYNLEGRQFSKSDGWYIDLDDFFKKFTTDQIRYAIASNAPETSDSEFNWKDFQARCNSDLLGKYGNLANRILVFIQTRCDGSIPDFGPLEEQDREFLKQIQVLVDQAALSYANFKVRRASQIVMELAQAGNIYFDSKKPWQDAKEEVSRERMRTTLACCTVCLKSLALISFPIIPATANQLWHLLGYSENLDQFNWNGLKTDDVPAGQKILTPKVLFQKIEDETIEQEIQKLKELSLSFQKVKEVKEESAVAIPPFKEMIDIEAFQKIDLRIGTILKAERVKKSKKLIELLVDIGLEERTIVAGIGEFETPEALIGRKVVVVANLKPAVLMGVASQGMLLAAKQGGSLELLSVGHANSGSMVS